MSGRHHAVTPESSPAHAPVDNYTRGDEHDGPSDSSASDERGVIPARRSTCGTGGVCGEDRGLRGSGRCVFTATQDSCETVIEKDELGRT